MRRGWTVRPGGRAAAAGAPAAITQSGRPRPTARTGPLDHLSIPRGPRRRDIAVDNGTTHKHDHSAMAHIRRICKLTFLRKTGISSFFPDGFLTIIVGVVY